MCFDSQVQMQSSGVPYYFDANKKEFNDQKISYFTFGSDTNMTFEPLNNFLKNENLIKLVNTYLGFQSSIYVTPLGIIKLVISLTMCTDFIEIMMTLNS